MWTINLGNVTIFHAKVAKIYTLTNSDKKFWSVAQKSGRPDLLEG